MAVVRELTTLLNFKLDRTNLNKFETSLIGLKTQATIAFSYFQKLASNLISTADTFTSSAIATKDLAEFAGIALKDFVSMQTVAEKLNLNAESFIEGIKQLSNDLREAQFGFGRLYEIARESGGKINFRGVNNQVKNTKDLLLDIFDYINSIGNQRKKLQVLSSIFNQESAGAWLRVIEKGREEFLKLAENEKDFADSFEKLIPDSLEYQKNLSTLRKEWSIFSTEISSIAVPWLIDIIHGMQFTIDSGKKFISILKNAPKTLDTVFLNKLDELTNFIKNKDNENNIKRIIEKPNPDALLNRGANINTSNINNNVKIDINVPEGTTGQQATVISENVREAMDLFWNEKTREVFNNSPQVE